MATLSLRAVCKTRHGRQQVLRDIDLDVADGEFVVLVGPSGCGKSTLLRMTAGLDTITSGDIRIGSRVVNQIAPQERNVAMVFQSYALYPHMTVAQNIAFGLRMRGIAADKVRERVASTARMLSLEALLERKPHALSGGQRQRVAMGRAIVREPALFLFDEPLSNLDAKLRSQMRAEIRNLHTRLGTTSLYVTHDQVEAMTLAQRIVVLNQGGIEQIGTPEQIYERPQSTFVASFMGAPAMNLLRGRLTADRQHFDADDGPRIPIAGASESGMQVDPNREYVLGIRPEHVTVTNDRPIHLPVDACKMLGADNLAFGRLGKQSLVVRLPYHQRPACGEQLGVALPAAQLHFFDGQSGRRVN
ncbi:sn-glycerol-3-phosphate ABC transporter ATP-binding protein UgpC [Paraburkholderia sp. BL21I4N1]|uniref:sn-glycerol-3-phosphate ABC transporter ATP-binding protein UgpC n=1 Tax=Paraburkholderia sp. BL21I4N1 TaxID=1938801 RepID=UPI000CFA8D6D|nr:sn-glycerol-3-phosphate ABC transporter ATP-binding protein UgpC [Paraburkholderia sp. BL21I4N1]PQV44870.1 carbohydrate ABC transporter ATP-binding protein (CUT1 family) [Paraburkholderia sp. BL21I4N1]